jgi:hypothetical protein
MHRASPAGRIPLPDKEIPLRCETAMFCSDFGRRRCLRRAEIDAQTDNVQRNVLHSQELALRFVLAESPVSGEQHEIDSRMSALLHAGPTIEGVKDVSPHHRAAGSDGCNTHG